MKSFHNSIDVAGQILIQYEADNRSQEERVLEVFSYVKTPMIWSEVQSYVPDMIEISVKRCLSNLKKKGLLEKTNIKVMGTRGVENFKYRKP